MYGFVVRACASLLLLFFAIHTQAQTTDTHTVTLRDGFVNSCTGWCADSQLGCGSENTVVVARFDDPLPQDVIVRSVSVTWRLGNGRTGSAPTATLDLNGHWLVPTVTLSTTAACNPAGAVTVAFSSGDFGAGFPGYASGQENVLSMTLTNGSVYPSEPPVLSITYNVPPPVSFNISPAAPDEDRRILISNSRGEYPYPHYQGIGGSGGMVPMSLRTRNALRFYEAGMRVYLRVSDPPDDSPYMNLAGNVLAALNDNFRGPATLEGAGLTLVENLPGVYTAVSGENGLVEFALRLPQGTAAGDNYVVESDFSGSFTNPSQSGRLTAWKRVFVEKRRMLRNGIRLAEGAPAGQNYIVLISNRYRGNQGTRRSVSRGDRVVLVHAPALDRRDLASGWYMEERNVLNATQIAGTTNYRVEFGSGSGQNVSPGLSVGPQNASRREPAPHRREKHRRSSATVTSVWFASNC